MPSRRQPSSTARGYGYSHKLIRKRLMANHVDGRPCSHCGLPMYGDAHADRNRDGKPLHAHHAGERAVKGGVANELLHDLCNKQIGDPNRQRSDKLQLVEASVGALAMDWP